MRSWSPRRTYSVWATAGAKQERWKQQSRTRGREKILKRRKKKWIYVCEQPCDKQQLDPHLAACLLFVPVCVCACARARRSPVDEQAIAHSRSPLHTIDSHSAAEPISLLSYHKTSSTSHCIFHWMFFILIFFLFFLFFRCFQMHKEWGESLMGHFGAGECIQHAELLYLWNDQTTERKGRRCLRGKYEIQLSIRHVHL